MLTNLIARACAAAVIVGTPLLAWCPSASAASSGCEAGTLLGVYSYSYTGFTVAANHAQIPFAVAGLGSYDGQGHVTGASTTTTIDGRQAKARAVPYTGTYTVTPDCRVHESDTDVTGAVYNYSEYTGPNGTALTFVETDVNIVATGTETRD
jgi:hypothetical protein